jgi:NAD(P)H-dependent flavin oxidoreductase YrpB (nitropropane dioxygenase family)
LPGREERVITTNFNNVVQTRHPIIQAGMGPFGTNKLAVAAANAGVLGLISSSGVDSRVGQPEIFKYFVKTGGAEPEDDNPTILKKIFKQTLEGVREKKGIFGVNVMVSAELRKNAEVIIDAAIEARKEIPGMADHFQVMFTSAGDPIPWGEKVKSAGFKWFHVVPSVKGALRCQKAGVDVIVASGHEGGFHTAWEPVHSLVLLPAVVEALQGSGIPVMGAGGFCDGKTLAAALALGASGIQMGTRFLATRESDFADIWKEQILETGDRGTLIARGFVGPARWLKYPATQKHAEATLKHSPGVYVGRPDDISSIPPEFYKSEVEGLAAIFEGDKERALMAGGECAQRIDDLPTVQELVERIIEDASNIIKKMPGKYLT